MKTATQAELEQHHGHMPGADEIDPEHEIDARKTKIWFAFFAVFVYVTWFLLEALFHAVVQEVRYDQIDRAPTAEKQAHQKWEADTLTGKNGGASIEDAMKRLAK